MAINNIATALRNTLCDAFVDAIDDGLSAGILEIWEGTPGGGSSTKLGTLVFSDPAFVASSSGTATASSITSDTSADNTGTIQQFRVGTSNSGTSLATALFNGTCGTSSADIIFNAVAVTAGDTIAVTSMTVTMPAS